MMLPNDVDYQTYGKIFAVVITGNAGDFKKQTYAI